MKLARALHTIIEKIGCRISEINVSKLNLLNSSRSKVQRKKWMINGMRLVRPKHGHKQMLNFQKLFEGNIFNFVFRRLSIGRQIAGAVLSVIVCYIGISAYSYYQLTQIDNNYNELLNKSAKMVSAAKGAAWYVSQSSSAMRGYLLTQDQGLLTLYPVYSAQVDNSVEWMQKNAFDPETKKYAKQIEDSKNAYSATVYAIQRYQLENNKEAFHAELKKNTEAIDKAIEAAEALVKVEEERLRKKNFENSEMTNNIKSQLIWVNIFTLVLGLGLACIISRKISRPISAIASTAAQIAEGNLLVRDISYNSSCEVGALGRSTNQMLSGLRSIILRISGGADHVKEASEMLSATATQMNTATARVATTIYEVASGAEQQLKVVEKAVGETDAILSGVERINMNVQTVAAMSETAALTAHQGRQTIEHTVAYLDEVSHKVKDTTQQTIGLTEASKKISGIINMITSIAGQTNLLALNAAIEAARAGDAGRGFAVVADEVRKLAEQSRASAQSIGQIVREIERQIESISYEMATRNQELSDGVSQASNAGQAFREITGHVEQLTAEIQSIRQTAAALSQNGSEVRKSMTQIEETARTNSMGAVEISAASEEQTAAIEEMTDSTHKLAALSSDLQKVVYQFKY